ncbi:MAG: aromatic amino acid lyase [Bdellovibrionales bacterium]
MGTIAARKFGQIVKNAENVVAMEFLCAAQALTCARHLKLRELYSPLKS